MERAVLPGDPPVEIRVRRSARARRFSLRVAQAGGGVTLSLPRVARLDDALAFVQAQEGWIRRTLARQPEMTPVCAGATLPFEGRPVSIVVAPEQRVAELRDDRLLLPARSRSLGAQVAGYLKTAARTRLAAACDRHAAALGRRFRAITLRDTRSRWGSCTSEGRLMFSWRLIMAPPEVLDYVAAHEVAHLAEMNHSPAFWAEVALLCPDYRARRGWLRTHGAGLHRFDFAAPPAPAGGASGD